jgi:hypothetical protein
MQATLTLLVGLAASSVIINGAAADPWKDESGKRGWRNDVRTDDRGHAREYKEEFRSGGCKVERKWDKKGGYKEEINCEGRR